MENFDKKAKPLFSGKSARGVYINTGLTIADAALNIKKGNILLTQLVSPSRCCQSHSLITMRLHQGRDVVVLPAVAGCHRQFDPTTVSIYARSCHCGKRDIPTW